jgi:hypothetical protein
MMHLLIIFFKILEMSKITAYVSKIRELLILPKKILFQIFNRNSKQS